MSFDKNYFSTHTYENITFARYSMYWWSNRFYATLARRHGKNSGKLLEIGSGMGHLVSQLEDTFETYGMDVNHWAVEQSKAVINKTALQTASAENLPFAANSFDLVIIKHIVEHLQNPEKAIAEIGRVTAPDGILILSTPNLNSLLKPWKGETWIGYQDPTHISLHPPETWLDWIQKSGFSLVRAFADGFWDVPYIPLIPNPLQKLFFGAPGGFQAITGWVFLPLRWGESIMVIAQKQ